MMIDFAVLTALQERNLGENEKLAEAVEKWPGRGKFLGNKF